jgi:hypothetical protein
MKDAFGVERIEKIAIPKFSMAGLGTKVGQGATAGLNKLPKVNANVTGKLRQVSSAASRNPTQMGRRAALGIGAVGTAGAGAVGFKSMNDKNKISFKAKP